MSKLGALDRVITVEITLDQACVIMAALEASAIESKEWLKTNKDSTNYAEVEEHFNLTKSAGRAIAHEMEVAYGNE